MTCGYYRTTMKKSQAKFGLRIAIVKHALKHGVSAAAREYNTTRKTVRKWRDRWLEKNSLAALEDRSRAPHHIPHKTPPATERRIVAIRKRFPRWGPERLKMHFDLTPSVSAVARIIRQHKLVRKRLKKWKRKRDLRQEKKRWKPLEKWQVDVKYLTDIPRYVRAMYTHKLPRYQYTARDVRTGAQFFAYGDACDSHTASLFANVVLSHLKKSGVKLKRLKVQTDNGSEFVGGMDGPSAFEDVLASFRVRRLRIPPGRSTWQSDVETVHRTIEDELYDAEDFNDESDFLGKTHTYQVYYNYCRPNRWRGRKSPKEILDELAPKRYTDDVLHLPPVRLESLTRQLPGGYHVPTSPSLFEFFT